MLGCQDASVVKNLSSSLCSPPRGQESRLQAGTEAAAQGWLIGDKMGIRLGNKVEALLSDGGQEGLTANTASC